MAAAAVTTAMLPLGAASNEDIGGNSNVRGTKNQQSTKSCDGNGNGKGNNDSNYDDDRNDGDGGGGRSMAIVESPALAMEALGGDGGSSLARARHWRRQPAWRQRRRLGKSALLAVASLGQAEYDAKKYLW